MPINTLIQAFRLPDQALVTQRIAKKLLVEQGAPTAADKRLIGSAVDELWWHAALKPGTVGVPAFRASAVAGTIATNDTEQPTDVIELALVSVQLRSDVRESQTQRLLQLIHRAIPYPVLLVAQTPDGAMLSLAHKRASLGEAGKWVLGDAAQTHPFNALAPTPAEAGFLAGLALDQLPRGALVDLAALYQAYADRITALAVARVTGRFATSVDTRSAAAQRDALEQRGRVQQELATVRGAATKARQLNRRVDLNLRIQRLQGQLQQIERGLCA